MRTKERGMLRIRTFKGDDDQRNEGENNSKKATRDQKAEGLQTKQNEQQMHRYIDRVEGAGEREQRHKICEICDNEAGMTRAQAEQEKPQKENEKTKHKELQEQKGNEQAHTEQR